MMGEGVNGVVLTSSLSLRDGFNHDMNQRGLQSINVHTSGVSTNPTGVNRPTLVVLTVALYTISTEYKILY